MAYSLSRALRLHLAANIFGDFSPRCQQPSAHYALDHGPRAALADFMTSWKLFAQASDAGHDSRGFADQQSALRENASDIKKNFRRM
jgi:hypothetical protein